MDQTHALIGAAAFVAGFWVRAQTEEKAPSCPACNCICKWDQSAVGSHQESSFSNIAAWVCACFLLLLAILILSNAALVFKVTLRDEGSGSKEIQIGVKGKSKGITGASRGLAITG